MPFHPYFTIKDMFGLCVFLLVFAFFVFYAPNFLGSPDNYIPANPMETPNHIVPEWYLLPYYAILRSVPNKLLRRHPGVRLDRPAVHRALARHLAGAQRPVPADLQMGVLAAGRST